MKNEIMGFPSTSGIYKITSPTNKIYIGEATNLKNRCSHYLNPNNVKKQRAIYNSLIKYLPEAHKIEIIELCAKDLLLERERYWQEFYDSVNNGLNCFLTKTSNCKKLYSDETKKIMSIRASGENNAFYNKKHTKETLEKMSNASKGDKNPNFGGKLKTPEWIKKQIESNSKKPLLVIDIITNNKFEFINSRYASEFIGCKPSKIRSAKSTGQLIKKRFLIKDLLL